MKYFIEDWGLWRRDSDNCSTQIFGFACFCCGRFTLGCKDHWFCGCCPECDAELTAEMKKPAD
jgi:hypothetical protein